MLAESFDALCKDEVGVVRVMVVLKHLLDWVFQCWGVWTMVG